MKPLLYLLLLPVLLVSCHSNPGETIQLTPTAIYNIDSVRSAAGGGDEKAARKQLMAAVNAYKNEKDAAKSIPLFKQSILLKPSAQAYYELGSALLDQRQYSEALSALHIAERLEYKPMANVLFRLAAASANTWSGPDEISKRDSAAYYYMQIAIQMGYAKPEEFRSSDWFKPIRDTFELYSFNAAYKTAMQGHGNGMNQEQTLWEEFRKEFTPIALPVTINTVYISEHPLNRTINFDYEKFVPEMRTDKFSREVSKEYFYYALVKTTSAYTALLYAGRDMNLEGANVHAPVFFFLSTYDPTGKIIDKIQVAGQPDFTSPFKVFTLQPNYTFEVRDFRNVYKEDPEKAGYDTNAIIRTDPAGVANYRIADNGRFEKTDAPLALR